MPGAKTSYNTSHGHGEAHAETTHNNQEPSSHKSEGTHK